MIEFKSSNRDQYALLREFARKNRCNMTDAECFLWQNIRGKRLGVQFLRQHIIGDCIVDFICRDNGLIIEVDGGYHVEPQQQENDAIRTEYLEGKGYHVIRFSNEEIILDIENVIDKIRDCINKLNVPQ